MQHTMATATVLPFDSNMGVIGDVIWLVSTILEPRFLSSTSSNCLRQREEEMPSFFT